ncbi:isoprenylcysteine carboxylmethyltransferase family protein [Polynucleobacter sp. MWH-P3-07-1]|uniref:methyltransferase family protein n=1 Tax=Polynucleobacter sp. MWH-P3-07-1 TaxID=1743173 RepID=UPI001BFDEECA|nr:isoprenylcysteine carboxylmethyltransferase family protein [Polynucleobacter sp. MWH-P3-07-1]QWD83131.1 isoprenylcysteine carboxylmethyltransferase family protein [Polynucleobacter sp. MWH-P3-07-1]
MSIKKLFQNGVTYVLIQAGLLGILFLGPTDWWGILSLSQIVSEILKMIALILFPLGVLIAIVAAIQLKRNLTPLPMPVEHGELIQTGLYAYVRHPIYLGVILMALAWFLHTQAVLTLVEFIAVMIFFEVKSRQEEYWMGQVYPEYAEYQRRTAKLVPRVY